jgi:hypothetical protein
MELGKMKCKLMKNKIIAVLIAMLAIAVVVIFSGCVEKEEITPSTPTPSVTKTSTPTPPKPSVTEAIDYTDSFTKELLKNPEPYVGKEVTLTLDKAKYFDDVDVWEQTCKSVEQGVGIYEGGAIFVIGSDGIVGIVDNAFEIINIGPTVNIAGAKAVKITGILKEGKLCSELRAYKLVGVKQYIEIIAVYDATGQILPPSIDNIRMIASPYSLEAYKVEPIPGSITDTPAPTSTATPTMTPTATPTATPAPTLTPTPRRLPTGTFIKYSLGNGYGELTIKNELSRQDAVAILIPIGSKSPSVAVYIRATDSFTVKGIKDGSYELYFTQGEDWDDQRGRFTKNVARERFEEPLSFETAFVTGGRQYTSITVTLYAVPGGTAESEPVPEEEFPDLRY